MKMNHFTFTPLNDRYFLFRLKRDRTLSFGISLDSGKAVTIKGVSDHFTDDEWLEAMRIHSAVINGTFDDMEVKQS